MDCISDPIVTEIWAIKSKQIGWSEVLLNALGYYVDQDPSPVMMVQPTLEMGESFSKQRIAPMIRDTPCLREKIADPRARDSGNTLREKNYPGGYMTIVGANSAAGLASRPIKVLLCDEVDKYPATAGASGDPISLARDRMQTFWNRKMLAGSTPTKKGQSRVETGFESSDQRYAYYRFPCCGEYQRFVWPQVKWTELGLPPKKAVYQCIRCGAYITNSQRLALLPQIEWRAAKPFNGIAGFHFNELMSPFSSLGEMAEAFVEAKKLPETLQSFINERLGETFEDTARAVEATGLAARREPYGPENIPAEVVEITLGVDTQDDRLELVLVGWGRDEESWIIQHHVLRGDPGVRHNKGVWQELTAYRRRAFKIEDGRTLRIQGTAIDFGGNYPQQVANYAYAYRFERVFAIRGRGGARLIWPRRPGKTKLSKADIYTLGVDSAKDVLYGRLAKIAKPGPGFIHLPAAVDDEFCEQLVNESKIYKNSGGHRAAVWRPKRVGAKTEAQDCWNYAYAVMIGRGLDLNVLANAAGAVVAKKAAAHQPPVAQPTTAAAPAPPSQDPLPQPPRPPAPRKKKPRFRVFKSNYLRR